MISGIDYGKGNDESCTITFISPEYIKELEEQRKMYKISFEEMSKNYFELQQKIEKATELLESQMQDMMGNYFFDDNVAEQLLVILEGDNNE